MNKLRDQASRELVQGHFKSILRMAWPDRRDLNYSMVIFDPSTGETVIDIHADLANAEQATELMLDRIRQLRRTGQKLVIPGQ